LISTITLLKYANTRTRFVIIGIHSVIILFCIVIVSAQQPLLKYRFFIRPPPSSPWKIIDRITYSTRDAVKISINNFLSLFDIQKPPIHSKLPSFYLRIEPGSFEKMASHLPQSAKKKFYRGFLLYPDGEWKKIKYRFRGRNIWHWHPEKPSLKLKLNKKNTLNHQRIINLISPEDRAMVSNVIGDEIGRRLGVLTHETKFVRLFANGLYMGVYHHSTNLDEELLRIRNRVPGPIFKGDRLSKKWTAEQFDVLGDPTILTKLNPMQKLISSIYSPPSKEKYDSLWSILSFDKLARWAATMNIVAGKHTDYTHNHAYYYDPTLGKLEPIISDINGHGLNTLAREKLYTLKFFELPEFDLPLHERLQPLLDVALKDPRFCQHKNEILYEAILNTASLKEQTKFLNNVFSLIDPDVKADHNKAAITTTAVGIYRIPYSNYQYEIAKEILPKWINKRNSFILDQLQNTRVSIEIEKTSNKTKKVVVYVKGHSSAKFDIQKFTSNIYLHLKLNRKQFPAENSNILLYPGLKKLSAEGVQPKYRFSRNISGYLK